MDAQQSATKIRDCFSLADEIIPAVQHASVLQAGDRLMIVGSDFYGSYWLAPGKNRRKNDECFKRPAEVLLEVRDWLRVSP